MITEIISRTEIENLKRSENFYTEQNRIMPAAVW